MDKMFLSQRKAAGVALVLLLVVQQLSASPVVSMGLSRDSQTSVQTQENQETQDSPQILQILRRKARMSPLWRVLNSKPFGAYCQNNIECSTGYCRGGFCATMHRMETVSVTN